MLCMTRYICAPLQSTGGFISFQDKFSPENNFRAAFINYKIITVRDTALSVQFTLQQELLLPEPLPELQELSCSG